MPEDRVLNYVVQEEKAYEILAALNNELRAAGFPVDQMYLKVTPERENEFMAIVRKHLFLGER